MWIILVFRCVFRLDSLVFEGMFSVVMELVVLFKVMKVIFRLLVLKFLLVIIIFMCLFLCVLWSYFG